MGVPAASTALGLPVSGQMSQWINRGGSGTEVTATPDDGYSFSRWSDDATTASRTDTNVQSNLSVTAEFLANHVITVTSTGQGQITPAGTSGAVSVPSGSSPVFTFTPADGYEVGSVKVDGVKQAVRRDWTFSNVRENHSIEVEFTKPETSGGGSGGGSGGSGGGSGSYTCAFGTPTWNPGGWWYCA